ncbi:hypothetical protein [Nocardia seriolae]|uniref:Uncharacterized protein n=1 Tax=Nocardia seriolae TaxID=37332 RepID=A0A0B8N7U4_9NOCA|nr:hypothetical protein [Nocardia seriolae]APB01699.1 hypothetical protein NS506_07680 [Nocardia seriolae]MTJ60833.1 hypothetical protein [Nocardia seriolae]MTJ76126.1 hypothetical protein [Nocardia seriolae]MTJ91025.1 hypothetical protein [Nocardia seriolae]MTK34987.1 hypothetical protein [Nocardia seriolae]
MIRNLLHRLHGRGGRGALLRVPVCLMFSAHYERDNDLVIFGFRDAHTGDGPALELALWQAVSLRDILDAAISDAVMIGNAADGQEGPR